MGQRTADRSPVADLKVADEGRRLGHEGHGLGHGAVTLDPGLADQRPYPERPISALDARQLSDAVEVDEVIEAGQAQGHHGYQALAPGQHLGVLPEVAQEGHGVGQRLRRVVLERGRLHRLVTTGAP